MTNMREAVKWDVTATEILDERILKLSVGGVTLL